MTYLYSDVISTAHAYYFIEHTGVTQPHVHSMISAQAATGGYHKCPGVFSAYKRNYFVNDILFVPYFALYFLCRLQPIIIKALAVDTINAEHLDISFVDFGPKGLHYSPVLVVIEPAHP